MSFKKWLITNTSGEVWRHARRRKFPNSSSYRDLKLYINTKYKRRYLQEPLIREFERNFDEYELALITNQIL